jgi:hypothetical protein
LIELFERGIKGVMLRHEEESKAPRSS